MKNVLFVAVLALVVFVSCSGTGFVSILPDGCKLKAGDLVFRRGNGITSRAVLMADQRGGYSHVGIVVDSCGKMMVVHAVPDEPDYEGDIDRVKMETPEKFFLSVNAKIGEVKRLKGEMYCCELVEHVYKKAGLSLAGDTRHDILLPGMRLHCILPSDLCDNERLESIISF